MKTWIWILTLLAAALWVTASYAGDDDPPGPGPAPGPRDGPPAGRPDGRLAGLCVARAADADRSGDVSTEEWKAFLASLGAAEDGTIDAEKLAAALPRRGPGRVAGRRRGPGVGPGRRGGSGMLARAFGKEPGAALTIGDLEKAFAGLDANDDGALDEDEMPRPPRGPRAGGARRGPPSGPGRGPGAMRGPRRGVRRPMGCIGGARGWRGPRAGLGRDGRGPHARGEGIGGPGRRWHRAGIGGPPRPPQRGPGRGMGRGPGPRGPQPGGPGRPERPPPRWAGGPQPGAPDMAAQIDRLTTAIERLIELLERRPVR